MSEETSQKSQGKAVQSFTTPKVKEAVRQIGQGPARGVLCKFSGPRN